MILSAHSAEVCHFSEVLGGFVLMLGKLKDPSPMQQPQEMTDLVDQ